MRATNRDLRLKTEEVVDRGIRYWCRDTSQPDAAYGVPGRNAALARVSYQMTGAAAGQTRSADET
jgi:hypothetical protein